MNLIFLLSILVCSQIWTVELTENKAKKYCSITKVNYLGEFSGKEIVYRKYMGLKCDIKNSDFTLDIESYYAIAKNIID